MPTNIINCGGFKDTPTQFINCGNFKDIPTQFINCGSFTDGPQTASLAISPSTYTLKPNQTLQFTSADENGNTINPIWSTSDNTIATIDSNGLLTAHKVGTVTVTAVSGGVTDTATVVVQLEEPKFPSLKPIISDKGAFSEITIDIENLVSSDKVIVEKATIPEGQANKVWSYSTDAKLTSGTLASGKWKADIEESKYIGNYFFRFKVVR